MVHGDGKSTEPTLADWVLEHYPEMKNVGEIQGGVIRPGIVHRIDKDTSGIVVLAKTQEAYLHLKKQFQDRTMEKEYHAFVWGHFKTSPVVVDTPIGRSKNDFRKWLSGRGIRGESREALTVIEAITQFNVDGENFSFIHAFPKTGRTHQIRVHCKHLQRPIVCDSLYGGDKPPALGFDRVALHARKIMFLDMSHKEIVVECSYPTDFATALAKYTEA